MVFKVIPMDMANRNLHSEYTFDTKLLNRALQQNLHSTCNINITVVQWLSAVVSTLASINIVNRHCAGYYLDGRLLTGR